jgi:uncharacterized protein
MESLNDKLKSLGVNLGMSHLNPARPEKEASVKGNYFPIEKVVEGDDFRTPFGDAFIVTKRYPVDFQIPHQLSRPNQFSSQLVSQTTELQNYSPEFIFLDTETSGLSGGSGTFAFLIGIGFFEQDHFLLQQIFMRHPQEEQSVIAALNALIGTTNTLVTFNGKSFDVPLLNTRHKLHGFSPVFLKETHNHIDMLTYARRIWKNRLPSRSLGDLERQILDIYRTDEEVPGYMIPDIYFDYLATGDARPISKVIYHNAMDIVSLAILFIYTNDLLLKPMEQKIDSMDMAAIARMFENSHDVEEAINLYKAAIEKGLPLDIYIQTIMRYANIHKQDRSWENALILWEEAAVAGSLDAALELAKYYEHQLRDIAKAIYWTQKGIALNQAGQGQTWSTRQMDKELNHRLDRLEHKSRS